MSYVVDVKPSARKRNAAAGEAVNRAGVRRRFESRAVAERWAASLSEGDGRVWVQAAHPADETPADAYLVSRRGTLRLAGAFDKRRRRLRGGDDDSQATLWGALREEPSLADW